MAVMLRALWFLVQLFVIVVAAVWLLEQPGSLIIEFLDYKVTASFGIGLLVLAALILIAITVYKVLNGIVSIPKVLSRYKNESARQRGYRAMTRGFVAVAAGNAKDATKFSKETRRFLPNEQGLPLLLEAQAARLRGEEGKAKEIFRELLKDRDAAFFGIRGLLKSAIDEGNKIKALDYARQALALNPKQPWIIKTVYDLELQNRRWDNALETAKKGIRFKAISKERAVSDHIAILLHRAREDELAGLQIEAVKKLQQAYKMDKCFVPTFLALGKIYMEQEKNRKVKSMLEKIWKKNPHPDLVNFWRQLAPENTAKNPMKQLRFFEKVLALKPDSVEGQMAIARIAMEASLWGEAKAYLTAAEKIQPLAEIYRMRAEIEQQTTKNEDVVRTWLLQASEAPAGKVWHCRLTGHIYDRWSAIAEPHGSFNTIEWGYPERKINTLALSDMGEPLLLEPAA